MRLATIALTAAVTLLGASPAPGINHENERYLPNANTITLGGENGNSFPGEAIFAVQNGGLEVRVKARVVQGRAMPAEIDAGNCGTPGKREQTLKPVKDGSSDTKLAGVKLESLQDGNHSLRVKDPANHGLVALCGNVRKPGLFSK